MNTKKLIANRYPLSANLIANRYPLIANLTANRYPLIANLIANRYPLNANLSANRYPPTTKRYHLILNIANGKFHSILELVEVLNKIMGKSIKPVFTPLRPGDVFKTLADVSKARETISYRPLVDFEEGLRRTVKYWQEIGTNKVNGVKNMFGAKP